MTGNFDPEEFEEYCRFVEQTLIDKTIPELLEDGSLNNLVGCYHVNKQFASLIPIPPEKRRCPEDHEHLEKCKILAEAGLLGESLEEYLRKREQEVRDIQPNTDVEGAALVHRITYYSKREHNGWKYIAMQHADEPQDLKKSRLFHPYLFEINTAD